MDLYSLAGYESKRRFCCYQATKLVYFQSTSYTNVCMYCTSSLPSGEPGSCLPGRSGLRSYLTYAMSLSEACMSLSRHWHSASQIQGLCGIRTCTKLLSCNKRQTVRVATLLNFHPLAPHSLAARITGFSRCTELARECYAGNSSTSDILGGIAQMQPRVQAGLSPDRESIPNSFTLVYADFSGF